MKKEFIDLLESVLKVVGVVVALILSIGMLIDMSYESDVNLAKTYSEIAYGKGTVEVVDSNNDEIDFMYNDGESNYYVSVSRSYAEDVVERGHC